MPATAVLRLKAPASTGNAAAHGEDVVVGANEVGDIEAEGLKIAFVFAQLDAVEPDPGLIERAAQAQQEALAGGGAGPR